MFDLLCSDVNPIALRRAWRKSLGCGGKDSGTIFCRLFTDTETLANRLLQPSHLFLPALTKAKADTLVWTEDWYWLIADHRTGFDHPELGSWACSKEKIRSPSKVVPPNLTSHHCSTTFQPIGLRNTLFNLQGS
jgi:hypothetical protein